MPDIREDTAQSLPGHLNAVDPSKAEYEEGPVAQAEERIGRCDVCVVYPGDANETENAEHRVDQVAGLVHHDHTFTGVLSHV